MIPIAQVGTVRRLDALCIRLLVEWLGEMVRRNG